MISSLLYLTASTLDIMFSIYLCVSFQSVAKESHLTVVKRKIKYHVYTKDIDGIPRMETSVSLVS